MYAPCRAERQRPALGHRPPNDAPLRLRGSQRIRKRIEEAFGWMKTIAGQGEAKLRGIERVGWSFTFAAAAYNLVRLPKLMTAP